MGVMICPARLKDPEHICTRMIRRQMELLHDYLTDCLEEGIKSGELNPVQDPDTVNLLIGIMMGVLRQRGLGFERLIGMRDVMVNFCKRSLVRK